MDEPATGGRHARRVSGTEMAARVRASRAAECSARRVLDRPRWYDTAERLTYLAFGFLAGAMAMSIEAWVNVPQCLP